MEKVKDLILYQVATDQNYKVGDRVVFSSSKPNGQYKKVMNSSALCNDRRLCDVLYEISKSRFKRLTKKQINEVAYRLDTYDVILRDLALENVRKEFYPNYPSRLHAMYLSETKEECLKNLQLMATFRGKTYQAVAVKLNGKIFRAGLKECMITRAGQSYSWYEEKAKAYWAQDCPKEKACETLFEGEAEIVEIMKEIKK